MIETGDDAWRRGKSKSGPAGKNGRRIYSSKREISMKSHLFGKISTLWKRRLIPVVFGAGIVYAGLFPATAEALFIDGPGRVLMVDGTDSGNTVQTLDFDLTISTRKYDFGFVATNGSFTSIVSGNKTSGSYTFTGGSLINFALRDTSTGKVYSINDPKDYADQIYAVQNKPSDSKNPVVSSPYYRALILEWDLSNSGNHPLSGWPSVSGMSMTSSIISELQMGTTDVGFAVITASNSRDGFAPVVAPVPLPPSVLLAMTGFGILALMNMKKRRSEGI